MAATYPNGVKTWTPRTDGVDDVMAADINTIYEEVTALETYAIPNNGDASDVTVAFTQASTRENLTSGEKLKISLGKLMKWFADLKPVAFTGSYSDLTDKPTIVDLGTFSNPEQLITHVIMNQLPTGHYTFIIGGNPYFMLLFKGSTFYRGTFHNSIATFYYFEVSIYGEIRELKTIDLRNLGDLEDDVTALIDYVDSLMPISGGLLENYSEKLVIVSPTSGSINLNLGNVFQHTPSFTTEYTISNPVSGVAHSFTLIINMGATARALIFPASVKWQGGEIPDLTTVNKTYVLTFMTVDGGTTWLGMFGGEF